MTEHADRAATRAVVRRVLAADCGCGEADFGHDGLRFARADDTRANRRRFPLATRSVLIATMGAGVVVSASPDRLRWLQSGLDGLDRDAVFAPLTVAWLAARLAKDRQELVGPVLRFVCSPAALHVAPPPPGIELATLADAAIEALDGEPGFGNALSQRRRPERPDVLATVARRGGEIVGVAGASADGDLLWQIGVDVRPAARRAGVGRALVSRLTEAVLARGRVPYYSVLPANVPSVALAVGLGFWPAWTDLVAVDHSERVQAGADEERPATGRT